MAPTRTSWRAAARARWLRWLFLWLPLLFVRGDDACRCWCCAGCRRWQRLHARPPGRGAGRSATGDFRDRLPLARPGRDLARTCRSRWSPPRTRNSPLHRGFDFKAIDKATTSNARGRKVRGASTISQQLAKNLFLWQGRSYVRKGLEAWYTVLIEALWPKRRILEVYANIAEFGDGMYGAEAAARSLLRQARPRADAAESARLAAVLPSPRRYNAGRPGPYVQRRAHWIQRQVRQLGGPAYLRDARRRRSRR